MNFLNVKENIDLDEQGIEHGIDHNNELYWGTKYWTLSSTELLLYCSTRKKTLVTI